MGISYQDKELARTELNKRLKLYVYVEDHYSTYSIKGLKRIERRSLRTIFPSFSWVPGIENEDPLFATTDEEEAKLFASELGVDYETVDMRKTGGTNG